MSLSLEVPDDLPPDRSKRQTISFVSPADGAEEQADIYSPSEITGDALPLVLAPHPISWTAAEDYHGGLTGLKRGYHPGWYNLADKFGVLIAMPHGHHRRTEHCSLASPEQITDMAYLIDVVETKGYRVDRHRVYACGLSMGGLETLVFAGKFPTQVAAVVVFNPIVDLAAWQQSMAISDLPEVKEFGTAGNISSEVGGLPREVPQAYLERSPFNYLDGLATVPALIFWSEKDIVVPNQATQHSYRLYQAVKNSSIFSPISEYNHTQIHGITSFDTQARWQLHEWCDYELALTWLLRHSRSSYQRLDEISV